MMNKGFTLIEMMIVIVIIGVLAVVAYPLYTNNMVKTQRERMKSELMDHAQKLQNYKIVNHSYKGASQGELGIADKFPKDGVAYYTVKLDVPDDGKSYTLTATPISSTRQKGDGVICFNSEKQKFWEKGTATCRLSSSSTWDK